ncbi:MAG: hypothetical protein JKY32_09750 [Rhizobiales bacterium]|nr:hypothetical protein [Hyphomicrobiales bacterium]
MQLPAMVLVAVILVVLNPANSDAAENRAENGVSLNQTYLESVLDSRNMDIGNIMDVFQHVFSSLPDEVTVYPTENYFYFQFGYRGLLYAGNMRLDVGDRDEGVVHFAYFNLFEDWNAELMTEYRPLNANDGVVIEKLEDLKYQISFRGRRVEFNLNDLRNVQPPANALAEGEAYLGPVFDESGIQFYLVFNEEEKYITFVLNENGPPPDRLIPYNEAKPDILLGMRTGFAFFQDPYRNRKILIGVYQGNVQNNNYFDGPFDQLPDNFIEGNELQNALLTLYPGLEGEIDRLGNFAGQQGRVLVNPYINYNYLTELDVFLDCREAADNEAALIQCILPQIPE